MRVAKTVFAIILSLFFASVVSAAEIKLTWTDVSTNEDGTNIYRREAPSGSLFNKIASVGVDVSQFTDMTATEGMVYCYVVRPFNSVGESESSNEACAQMKIEEQKPPDAAVALGFKLDLDCKMERLADGSIEITCPPSN